jgi:hypothetical protein
MGNTVGQYGLDESFSIKVLIYYQISSKLIFWCIHEEIHEYLIVS